MLWYSPVMFARRRVGAWQIDATYQFVFVGAMGAILSRWG